MKLCAFPECGRPLLSRGLCQSHYWQERRGEELHPIRLQRRANAGQECSFAGCVRHATAKGLCPPHRKQQLRGEPLRPIRTDNCITDGCESEPSAGSRFCEAHAVCQFAGCDRKRFTKGLCQAHDAQRRRGADLSPIHVPTHRYVSDQRYVLLYEPEHPNANKNGLVLEHVAVMGAVLGRPVRSVDGENVHHLNGDRADNRPENLELWIQRRQPKGQRLVDLVPYWRQMLARYEAEYERELGSSDG